MNTRAPNLFPHGIALSAYVRDELLSKELAIEPQAILAAHRSLREALNDQEIPYLVRKQGASGPWSQRGKESQIPGVDRPVVFTDNSPPVWLHHHLRSSVTAQNRGAIGLEKALAGRAVPAAHSFRADESVRSPEWAPLNKCMGGVYPPIWTAGWKLSHILPCSPQRGQANDPLAKLRSSDPENYFKVRFLRNLSPFNFFLSPSPRRHTMDLDNGAPRGRDLGEDPRVIDWVVRILHDEVFAPHPEIQAEFALYLREVGLGIEALRNVVDGTVKVSAKHHQLRTLIPKGATPSRVGHTDGSAAFILHSELERPLFRVYQVNQGVSKETYSGLLVAPDESKGGWKRLREMKIGDVIFHNQGGRISAVSLVEAMDRKDDRLVSRAKSIKTDVEFGSAFLAYNGEHLTISNHRASQFLTCLIRTVLLDISFPSACQFGGYAVELKAKHFDMRFDLVELAAKAWEGRYTLMDDDDDDPTDC